MGKMWSGRFAESSSELLEAFNASIEFDRTLYLEDIEGSQAHARMLAAQGILTSEEAEAIVAGLEQVRREIEAGEFLFVIADEDIHMAVEKRLTEIIGEAGKKLHTARSRNDQVAFDFKLWTQRRSLELAALCRRLIATLVDLAADHSKTLMPGMTHLQHAQPINFGYHLLAYASMLVRDHDRFIDSYRRNNLSPLGCAALAGTPHPIDRQVTAKALGFDAPTLNCLDTVSDRDFALEMLFNCATAMMHLSRLSEELILWSSYEFGWISLSDRFSTGSSIMPQKKNPDVPELIRGKTGRVYGDLMGLLTVMKGLPLAYNKDMQEDKEGVFDAVKTLRNSLVIMEELLRTMTVHPDKMAAACLVGHLTATDLADYLVKKGVPFRETHHIAGRAVALAEKKGCDLSQLELSELQRIDGRIEADVFEVLKVEHSMNARRSYGATATARTEEQIEKLKVWLKERE
ncbi:MAG: argininosuccinate lyase [Campylobacterales bacterium]